MVELELGLTIEILKDKIKSIDTIEINGIIFNKGE